MYTLDIKRRKSIITYVIASIVCIIINYGYSKFGHGVTSNYMTFMFLYPLIGGIFFSILNRNNVKSSNNLFACGIITLTVRNFINGVLEIAGATSIFTIAYYIIGIILIIVSLVFLKCRS